MIEEAIETCEEIREMRRHMQGVLAVERRDCSFGIGKATFIQVVGGA